MVDATGGGAAPSKANLALGLGAGAVVAMLIGIVISSDNSNDWIWFVMAALGLGGLVTGLMDGRGKPVGRALGVVLSALVLVLFLLFLTGVLE